MLGVVRMHGRAHGYQVRRELRTWAADAWANVQPGSIYHALKKLTRDGLLVEVGTDQSAAGPDRTVYELTPDGETEFFGLLGDALARPQRGTEELSAGVSFLTTLPRKQAVQLLRYRLTELEGQLATAERSVDTWVDLGKPAHVTELARLWVRSGEMNIGWTRELIERLERGEYQMADDSPDHFGAPPRSPGA